MTWLTFVLNSKWQNKNSYFVVLFFYKKLVNIFSLSSLIPSPFWASKCDEEGTWGMCLAEGIAERSWKYFQRHLHVSLARPVKKHAPKWSIPLLLLLGFKNALATSEHMCPERKLLSRSFNSEIFMVCLFSQKTRKEVKVKFTVVRRHSSFINQTLHLWIYLRR